ncbi:hypothetical protein DEU56DRAFT_831311 [Suillus clintonianus]|uniref:uncharacterized protein n=1 Tax=Suillus clintonianus TaxID=1904413 RepID=UPI001B87BBDD|nr:uncharacterized protein DEU56DRAFT_831311 [Suillus clintonianus]KAG2122784.1 hypothetical protein DEU56DRAFT_831311 [Suillus clintonianus]
MYPKGHVGSPVSLLVVLVVSNWGGREAQLEVSMKLELPELELGAHVTPDSQREAFYDEEHLREAGGISRTDSVSMSNGWQPPT